MPAAPRATPPATLWAPRAWVAGRWRTDVLLRTDSTGHWAEVRPDAAAPAGAQVLPGPVLPGLVDAHSHAFQRAFAGLAERRSGTHDDFWSWRDRMYGVALRITPAQLRAVATQLYAELLAGGYTHVCEFHYLHHQPDGRPYADPSAMARALAEAAASAGIGLTLLPVLYERAGFLQPALRDDQRRFATTVDNVLRMRDAIRAWQLPHVHAGVAVHSLRAASPASLQRLVQALAGDPGPIHIHIAEQTGEVDDCLEATGFRPIEWLAQHLPLDARWQLVHATHAGPAEIDAVAASGAGVVLCPTTEANLGDGLPDLPHWLSGPTPLSIGSDSQVCRSAWEEMRWLEYAQRLHLRRRNVAARPDLGIDATAASLLGRLLAGGAAAAGFDAWGLAVGARADLVVLDTQDAALRGLPSGHLLDGLVFATPQHPVAATLVAGRWVGRAATTADDFADAMQALHEARA